MLTLSIGSSIWCQTLVQEFRLRASITVAVRMQSLVVLQGILFGSVWIQGPLSILFDFASIEFDTCLSFGF